MAIQDTIAVDTRRYDRDIQSVFGGGGIEINLAHRGYTVHAYDNYQPLVNFWQHWLDDPEAVRLAAYELLSVYSRYELNVIRQNPGKWLSGYELHAFYLICNRFLFVLG